MKSLLCVSLVVLTSCSACVQNLVIEQSRQGGPYAGVSHHVDLTVGAGKSTKRHLLVVQGGRVWSHGSGHYTVLVDTPGRYVLEVRRGNRTRLKVPIVFRRQPLPIARVAGRTGGEITASVFRVQDGIIVYPEHLWHYERNISLRHFRVRRFAADGVREDGLNTGARFTDSVRALIDRAKPGDVYLFFDIVTKAPTTSNDSLLLDDVVFRLR